MAASSGDDSASIYRTDDGGTTWVPQEIPEAGAVSKIRFRDKNIGWAICGIYLCFTENGGEKWDKIDLHEDRPRDIALTGNQLVVLTNTDKILKITK
jgi:photosystem II stability/assembly factor-like uncharacterized protein